MALDDILDRIAADAEAEASAIESAADAAAAALVADARAASEAAASDAVRRAGADARREAETVRANARLRARDARLAQRQALAEEVLAATVNAIAALPDERYAALIAGELADAAARGERVLIAAADDKRLRKPIASALEAASLALADEAADIPFGVLLLGDRTRLEISPRSLVDARRAELLALADSILFPEGA